MMSEGRNEGWGWIMSGEGRKWGGKVNNEGRG